MSDICSNELRAKIRASWAIFSQGPIYPEAVKRLKEAKANPEELFSVGWKTGFYCCLFALQEGGLKDMGPATKPEA
jgi:hypothetical protein